MKETRFICSLCETGSELWPYLKDLHPAGFFMSCEETHVFICCSYLPCAEGTGPACPGICLLMDCYQGRVEGGSWQVGCHLAVESLSQALNTPGHLIQG